MGQTQEQMAALALQARSAQEPKKRYAFWETQPVSQFDETAASVSAPGRRFRKAGTLLGVHIALSCIRALR